MITSVRSERGVVIISRRAENAIYNVLTLIAKSKLNPSKINIWYVYYEDGLRAASMAATANQAAVGV